MISKRIPEIFFKFLVFVALLALFLAGVALLIAAPALVALGLT